MKIQDKINQATNDFSREEAFFKQKTSCDLLAVEPFKPVFRQHLSVSIIIPAFKSHNTIVTVLRAISRQYFLERGGKLEVIISDDCSSPPLLANILKFKNILDVKYIFSFKNRGAGASRDVAIKIAQNDIVIFIDSDIIIPPSFIDNHILVHSALNSENIVVSFRENVLPFDKRIKGKQRWTQGNMNLGDHRTTVIFRPGWVIKSSEKNL